MLQSATTDTKKATARGNSHASPAPVGGLASPPIPVLGDLAALRLQRKCDCGGGPDCDCSLGDHRRKEKDSPRTALHRKPAGAGGLPTPLPDGSSTVLNAETQALFETRMQRKAAATARQPFIQAKLRIGAVDDPLEHEADRAADRAMSTTGSIQPMLQRAIAKDDIQEQLVHAYLSGGVTLQRQVAGSAGEQADEPASQQEAAAGEEILMQAKSLGGRVTRPGRDLESATRSLEGRGAPLSSNTRHYMESRFGHDFGNVRVHADTQAAELARTVNARAFTFGRNLVFAAGEYAPDGSDGGRRLLAHELAHVIQQGQAGPQLQRKIMVAGKAYSPSAAYLTWLNATFGPAMREFVEGMHNGGNPPVYSFSSYEQMGYEVRVRGNAIKGMGEVHAGCCGYYGVGDPPHLDPTYWDQVGGGVDFKLKSPLPGGKQPSDAIEAIFAPGAHTRLECLSMTVAIEYYSLLKGLGAAKFNAKFPAGIEIAANPSVGTLINGPDKKYDIVTVASKSEILPGDWVYFQNFRDYLAKHPGGYWQGENAVYLGGGMFRGFGVAAQSETDLNQELVNQYNGGAPPPPKTVADLLADGGGLLLSPVVRPIMAKIAP